MHFYISERMVNVYIVLYCIVLYLLRLPLQHKAGVNGGLCKRCNANISTDCALMMNNRMALVVSIG